MFAQQSVICWNYFLRSGTGLLSVRGDSHEESSMMLVGRESGQVRAGSGSAGLALRVALLSLVVGFAGPASGADFTIETAQRYTGQSCGGPCNTFSTLNHGDDRADYFESAMVRFGESRKAHYKNGSVWASDWMEDHLGGEDHLYGDVSRLLFVTGHGDSRPPDLPPPLAVTLQASRMA